MDDLPDRVFVALHQAGDRRHRVPAGRSQDHHRPTQPDRPQPRSAPASTPGLEPSRCWSGRQHPFQLTPLPLIQPRAGLRRHQREIDELNVYPVPDGDTGTNLAHRLTARLADRGATRVGGNGSSHRRSGSRSIKARLGKS
jgi:hypothetical protein